MRMRKELVVAASVVKNAHRIQGTKARRQVQLPLSTEHLGRRSKVAATEGRIQPHKEVRKALNIVGRASMDDVEILSRDWGAV